MNKVKVIYRDRNGKDHESEGELGPQSLKVDGGSATTLSTQELQKLKAGELISWGRMGTVRLVPG
jgi:hypothetical protein